MPKPHPTGDQWNLEDAKAQFSEVVRRARSQGPQRVTRNGKPVVVVVATEQVDLLVSPPPQSLAAFLAGSALSELSLDRPEDRGRPVVP